MNLVETERALDGPATARLGPRVENGLDISRSVAACSAARVGGVVVGDEPVGLYVRLGSELVFSPGEALPLALVFVTVSSLVVAAVGQFGDGPEVVVGRSFRRSGRGVRGLHVRNLPDGLYVEFRVAAGRHPRRCHDFKVDAVVIYFGYPKGPVRRRRQLLVAAAGPVELCVAEGLSLEPDPEGGRRAVPPPS